MKTCPLCKLTYPDERAFCFVDGADLVSVVDARLGTTIVGRYRLEHVLGEGGMATVYAGHHTLVERECAVKVMNPMFARDPVVRERFFREAKNTIKLAHPNVIDIFDHGECEDGTPFLVMERLNGSTLAEIIAKGPVPLERALGLMIQIACGIARAHDLDVIHRDLKPENIFVCRRQNGKDLVKILDFGIARALKEERLTSAGEVFGTPQYMAPERISQASDPGASSDLYSLGVVFFEIITGKLPFDAREIASIFVKHLREAPPSARSLHPEIPRELDELILRMLAKTPDGRPVDAHKVQEDLTRIARSEGVELPVEPAKDQESSRRAIATTLSPTDESRWQRATERLQKLLLLAYGTNPPAEALRILGSIRTRVPEVVRAREETLRQQGEHEHLAERGREGRLRFGAAVDALGQDASKAKSEERAAQEALVAIVRLSDEARARYQEQLREVVFWEGRSGVANPTRDLSEAYRQAAESVDAWLLVKRDESRVLAVSEEKKQVVRDLEFQIRELRAALAAHEKQVEVDEQACSARVTEAGRRADALDDELRTMAKHLLEPLQSRAEYQNLFEEIQRDTAA